MQCTSRSHNIQARHKSRSATHLPASFYGVVVRFTELLDEGCLVLFSDSQLPLQTLLKLQMCVAVSALCAAKLTVPLATVMFCDLTSSSKQDCC